MTFQVLHFVGENCKVVKDNMFPVPPLFKAIHDCSETEGIIPAPESCHAIAATIREALKAKEEGKEKVILFCLSGHGLIDMPSYDSFINGDLHDYSVSDEEIQQFLKDVPKVD